MNDAQKNGDWPRLERLCRSSIDQDGANEGNATSLANAVMRQGRTAEALEIGRRAYRQFPSIGSAAMYAHTAISAQAFSEARTMLRQLCTAENQWGQAGPWIRDLIGMAAKKVYRLTYTIPEGQATADREYWVPLPLNTVNQHFIGYQVSGALVQRTSTDVHGNKIVVIRCNGGKPVVVTEDVALEPYNSSIRLRNADHKAPGPELRRYLGKTVGNTPSKTIDPTAPEVQKIVAGFKKGNDVQMAEQMMGWVSQHLTYCPAGSPPGLDDSTEVIKRGGGHCEALTQAEVAILRACGVPARLIRGRSAVMPNNNKSTQHTIVQIWLSGLGWVDWDHRLPKWTNRDNYVREWTYEAVDEPAVKKLWEFHGVTFQALKGYRHDLLRTSLEEN